MYKERLNKIIDFVSLTDNIYLQRELLMLKEEIENESKQWNLETTKGSDRAFHK